MIAPILTPACALVLALRVVDRAVETGCYLSRQIGGAATWAVVLWGVRRG